MLIHSADADCHNDHCILQTMVRTLDVLFQSQDRGCALYSRIENACNTKAAKKINGARLATADQKKPCALTYTIGGSKST